jgi:hypothetical protein
MLTGAAIGFTLMYLLLNVQLEVKFSNISTELTFIFMGISILLIIFSLFGYFKIKAEAKKHVTGEEEDERDALQYRIFSDITFATNTTMYLSILMLAIVAVTNQHNSFIFISLALTLINFALSMLYSELARSLNSDRNLPSINDKNYAKKLLEMSDEGERHVMLQGMYRAFTSINALLFFALLLLIAYSVITGVSQLFGIFLIVFILVITNLQYMLTVRNK